jgi:hypothetical protein
VVVVVELLPSDGDEPVFTVVLEDVEDEPPEAGDDLSMTVVFSLFFSAGGVTVVSFCSHAARKAKLTRMHKYFILQVIRKRPVNCASKEWLSE